MPTISEEVNEAINKLVRKYRYHALPADLSKRAQDYYRKNIPTFLHEEGGGSLYTLKGTRLCSSYKRIVVGDYGAYIEFLAPATKFVCRKGQEYRMTDGYNKHVKYLWFTIEDGSYIKIYYQLRPVSYADYKPKRYYVSVYAVKEKGELNV